MNLKEKIKMLHQKITTKINNINLKIKENLNKLFFKPKKAISSFFKLIIKKLLKISNFLKLPEICKKLKLDKLFNYIKRFFKSEFARKLFLMIIVPILIYLYTQLFCNGKIIFEHERMYLNFILIYMIIGIFYCLTGNSKLSLYITSIFTFLIGIINYFITAFRGTPLVPWDIFSVNVALTVLPTFTFSLSKKGILGVIIFIINILLLKKFKLKRYKNNKFKIFYRIAILAIVSSFFYNFYLTDMISKYELDENWDPKEEYHNNGLMASLFKQSRNLIIHQPDGYDVSSLTSLENAIDTPIIENSDEEKPNIIMIMNESFSDLSVVGNFTTNEDYMPFIRSLKKDTIKGNLHVSVFGAQTPNTEWEVLTSNSMAFVPKRTIPYQQYVLRNSYSIATILNDQNYESIAMHSYYPQGYNRNLAYPRLGFKAFYNIYTMHDLDYIREYPSDISTYRNIIELYENKDENQKLFNFTLTMQNHGSYTDEDFIPTIIANNGEYPKLNQYLSLIKIADNSFKELVEYFSKQDEHTIIVMFGDHQPYVEDEFYEALLSQNYTDITSNEATERKYITPFIIWANYDIEEEKYSNITDISTNYLTSLVLDVAGLQKTPYLTYLDKLREEIPVITGNGYIDKNNIYHDFSEENEYSELLNSYHYLQFNNMFDNSSKLTDLFTIPKQNIDNLPENIEEEKIDNEIEKIEENQIDSSN